MMDEKSINMLSELVALCTQGGTVMYPYANTMKTDLVFFSIPGIHLH